MKAGYKEFLKKTVEELQGDQDRWKDHLMKMTCRKLLKADKAQRKAKRQQVKQARRRSK